MREKRASKRASVTGRGGPVGEVCGVDESRGFGGAPGMGENPKRSWLAGLIYGGTALVVALVFWLVTTFTGSFSVVARYGGAAWVFILMMIVLMPIVIPVVGRRRRTYGENKEGLDNTSEDLV